MTSIIAEDSPRSAHVWLPPAVLVAVSTLLECLGSGVNRALRYDRLAVDQGQWWRLLSANFVHLGWWHLFLNALSLALLVALCPERLSPFEWLRRVLLVGLGMTLGLHLFVPALNTYVGLSGLIYGLFLLGLGRQAVARDGIAVACLVFLACRIIWELTIGAPESEQQLIGGGVVAESHLCGVIAAGLYGLAFGRFARGARPAQPPETTKTERERE
ncbi:MAG: rhombosortase [Nevskia sp.]